MSSQQPQTGRHPDWQTIYERISESDLAWHFEDLDPDLEIALQEAGIAHGRLVDIGCGSGAQAQVLAEKGFKVLGVDISASAIQIAKTKRGGPNLEFQVFDIVSGPLDGGFDCAFDRGCFHVLEPGDRIPFVKNVASSLNENGLLFLKCFSHEEPERGFGPLRLSPEEIAIYFSQYFKVLGFKDTVFQGSKPHKPKSLFITLRKK